MNEFEKYIQRCLMETFDRLIDEALEREFRGTGQAPTQLKGILTELDDR
jgi:hypothetical protein